MFIEMLSMASPLQTRELAHFTLASPCLLSQEQLTEPQSPEVGSSQATRERFILTDMLYPVDGFQLERQIRLGPPTPPNGPTALIFTGGITRLNLAMQQLILDVLTEAPAGTVFWVLFPRASSSRSEKMQRGADLTLPIRSNPIRIIWIRIGILMCSHGGMVPGARQRWPAHA